MKCLQLLWSGTIVQQFTQKITWCQFDFQFIYNIFCSSHFYIRCQTKVFIYYRPQNSQTSLPGKVWLRPPILLLFAAKFWVQHDYQSCLQRGQLNLPPRVPVGKYIFRLFPIISISQNFFSFFFLTLEKIGIDEKVICYHNISN